MSLPERHPGKRINLRAIRTAKRTLKSVRPIAARHASKLNDIVQGLHGLARSRLALP